MHKIVLAAAAALLLAAPAFAQSAPSTDATTQPDATSPSHPAKDKAAAKTDKSQHPGAKESAKSDSTTETSK